MQPTFHRVFRETPDGPIMADTSGGVIHIRFLSDSAKTQFISKVNKQTSWADLEANTQPWSLLLDGTDKPDWDYRQAPEPEQDQEHNPQEQFDGGTKGDGQGERPSSEADPLGMPVMGDAEGGGNGEDDDKPVFRSELLPWAEQVVGVVAGHHSDLDVLFHQNDKRTVEIALVSQETAKVRKELEAKIDKLARNNKQGGGSGAIVKVEVVTPREVRSGEGLFHNQFPLLTKLVASGMHVFLPGPPGTGKSHAAEQIAGLLGWEFGSISLGPTTPESRLWGGMDANGRFHEPGFVSKARFAMDHPESGAIFCMDEMDNGHPGILATLNSAMANGWFTAPNGDTIRIGSNFVIIAAANTYGTGPTSEFSGRNRLDAATLDRFAYVPWDTDTKVESTLVRAFLAETENGPAMAAEWLDVWRTCRKNVETNHLKIFVTMRGAIAGSKLLSQGIDVDTVLNVVLLNKIPKDQAAKINPL